jgi:helix-turn-helix protein
MSQLISIPEAARELDLDPSRVRALVANGEIAGQKVGGRWVVDRNVALRRKRDPRGPGRPFEPGNAWGLIFLASAREAAWLGPVARSQLRRALALQGLSALRSRLGQRAQVQSFSVHPGELRHLLTDRRLVRSGVSAAGAHDLELVSGAEADGYLRASDLEKFVQNHALVPSDLASGSVALRIVPNKVWPFKPKDKVAPLAAVALDLSEDPDPRSARIGQLALKQIDRALRRR